MIFGPLKKTWAPFGLNFTRRLKLDPRSHTCTHAGGSSPQPALSTQPVALGDINRWKSCPEATWHADCMEAGLDLQLLLVLESHSCYFFPYWLFFWTECFFILFPTTAGDSSCSPEATSSILLSVPVPVWTAPASDGQLQPDSTPNHFLTCLLKTIYCFRR